MTAVISIVICTKNRESLLKESIFSVLEQSYAHWELIIVDDGSKENVLNAVDRFLSSKEIKFIGIRHEESKGIAVARNVGVAAATGEYIYFLDDDDLLIPSALEYLLNTAKSYGLNCVFHDLEPFGDDAESKLSDLNRANQNIYDLVNIDDTNSNVYLFDSQLYKGLLVSVPVSFQKCLFTRALWNEIGGMREESMLPEPEWAIKASLFAQCGLLRRPIYKWRVQGQNYFSLKVDEHKIQMRVVENYQSLLDFSFSHKQLSNQVSKNIKLALGNAWFCVAWEARNKNQCLTAFKALCESLKYSQQIKHVKLLIKIVLPVKY